MTTGVWPRNAPGDDHHTRTSLDTLPKHSAPFARPCLSTSIRRGHSASHGGALGKNGTHYRLFMSRKLLASAALAPLLLCAGGASAETQVTSSSRTTPIATSTAASGAADDVTITSDGAITLDRLGGDRHAGQRATP
jgi:hypothetical protein